MATGELVYYAQPTELGALLLVASARGLVQVSFTETSGEQAVFVERCGAQPATGPDAERLNRWGQMLSQQVATGAPAEGIALELHGTAFQRQVWQALRCIATGRTQSYAGLAQQIGRPRAVRAVASACAANPVALVIPCHRVIRSDGGLGGYHWGLARKRALLEREARWAAGQRV